MVSQIKALVIASALLFSGSLFSTNQAQPQTEMTAVQLIGVPGIKQNTKGRLSIVNGNLRFSHDQQTFEVTAASIEEVLTGKDSKAVVGETLATVATFVAPYGTGSALPLLRKKLDTLTIQYRDANGGLHGAVFTIPVGKAELIKTELIAHGARTTIPTQADIDKITTGAKERK